MTLSLHLKLRKRKVNQLREWRGKCQMCFVETKVYTMSMVDVMLICLDCRDREAEEIKNKKGKEKNEQ